MKKKDIEMLVDMGMTIILPVLMAYSLTGKAFHMLLGIVMTVLFIVHQILNLWWYEHLFCERYTPKRIFQTCVNILLIAGMLAEIITGVLSVKHTPSMPQALHLCIGYWLLILMCIHAGSHFTKTVRQSKRKLTAKLIVLHIVGLIICLYGLFALWYSHAWEYLFMFRSTLAPEIGLNWLELPNFIAMMGLFCIIGSITSYEVTCWKRN